MSGAVAIGAPDASPATVEHEISLRARLLGTWRGRFSARRPRRCSSSSRSSAARSRPTIRPPRASTCSPSRAGRTRSGTTEQGSDVLSPAARRRPRLDRRRLRGGGDLGRARDRRRAGGRLLRRLDRPHPRRVRELVPGDPGAAADDRPRAAARALAVGPDRGHRADLVGRHGADRPRPGPDPARARLRRAGPGARAPSDGYIIRTHILPEHAAADLRQHGADRRRRDPRRGLARVPRARRPDPDLLGHDARERVQLRRAERRRLVVRDPARALHRAARLRRLADRLPVRGRRQPAAARGGRAV